MTVKVWDIRLVNKRIDDRGKKLEVMLTKSLLHVIKKEDPIAFAELKALVKEVENGFLIEPVDEGP